MKDNKTVQALLQDLRNGIKTLQTLLKWIVLAAFVGVLMGFVGSLFAHVLSFANRLRETYPAIVLCLPAGGLLIVLLYRRHGDDRGTNTVIASIHSSTDVPFRMAPLIFISTAITHLCGGSSGREGAAIQLGGSIANSLGKVLELDTGARKMIILCGMSAGFSALFGTPMAAAIFSLEVVSIGIMHYSSLVPCVIASLTANFTAKFFRVAPEVFPVTEVPALDPLGLAKMLLFASVLGVISILFCLMLHNTGRLYKRLLKNPYLRIAAAGVLIILLSCLLRTGDYLGSGMGLIEQIFHEGTASPWAFLLKMVFTALTLGAGFKGGEIVPSFTVGAAFGAVAASVLGLPVPLAAACGMVGVFCGVTNCPITSLLISFELFGFAGMPWYLVAVSVSYMLSGRFGLYREQRQMYSKLENRYINTYTR